MLCEKGQVVDVIVRWCPTHIVLTLKPVISGSASNTHMPFTHITAYVASRLEVSGQQRIVIGNLPGITYIPLEVSQQAVAKGCHAGE